MVLEGREAVGKSGSRQMSLSGASGARADSAYRRDIDGLRAIAVTSVVLYHAGLAFLPGGFVGVDIFFVISGYLIGGILLREVSEKRFKFTEFYARRARRILPALIVVVLAASAFGLVFLTSMELKAFSSSAISALAGVANIRFWQGTGYFTPSAHFDPLLMTWSLGVEEQFYVVFPFLLLAIAKLTSRKQMFVLAGLTVASFVLAQVMIAVDPQAAFYLLPARAWEMAIGALLACVHKETGNQSKSPKWVVEAQGALGLGLIAASIAIFNAHTPVPGWPMIAPVAGAALLLNSHGSFVNRHLLSAGPMVFIGLISYSWYLWHWPLMTFARIASPGAPPLLAMLLLAAISFLLAIVSWRWVEQPFRHRKMSAPAILVRYVAAGVAAVFALTAFRVSDGLSQRLPASTLAIERVVEGGRGTRCLRDYGDVDILRNEECLPGPKGKAAMAIFGDSHAAALGGGLTELALEQGIRPLFYVKSACTPLAGVTVKQPWYTPQPGECASYLRKAVTEITSDPDIKLVVLAAAWALDSWVSAEDMTTPMDRQTALETGLNGMIDMLRAADKEVVVLGDVPAMTFNVPRYAMGLTLPLRRQAIDALVGSPGLTDEIAGPEFTSSAVLQANEQIRKIVGRREDASFVNLADEFCAQQSCRFAKDGEVWYFDNAHLSEPGSMHAVQGLRSRLAAATGSSLLARSWAAR